jgi:hypothetical protein
LPVQSLALSKAVGGVRQSPFRHMAARNIQLNDDANPARANGAIA